MNAEFFIASEIWLGRSPIRVRHVYIGVWVRLPHKLRVRRWINALSGRPDFDSSRLRARSLNSFYVNSEFCSIQLIHITNVFIYFQIVKQHAVY